MLNYCFINMWHLKMKVKLSSIAGLRVRYSNYIFVPLQKWDCDIFPIL